MRIDRLGIRTIDIPFRTTVAHSSARRSRTEGVWVEAVTKRGAAGQGEGCPRRYVTGESVRSALAFFHAHRLDIERSVTGVSSLREWAHEHRESIDANPAAWCAIELALLSAVAEEQGRTVEEVLGLPAPAGEHCYSAVLDDGDRAAFACQFGRYRGMGFSDFKLKTSGRLDRDLFKIETLRREADGRLRVRFDANNAWRGAGDAIAHLRSLDYPFFAVEEPLVRGPLGALERIGRALDTRIVLDESITRLSQLEALRARPDAWIVNIRVSKLGGLLRSIEVALRARELGLPIILGAHVGETSLLARAALTVAGAAGPGLIAREGAFGTHLLEWDVCRTPVMFGPGGRLVVDDCVTPGAPGFGLNLHPEWRNVTEVAA